MTTRGSYQKPSGVSRRLGLPTALAITPDGAVLFRRTPPREFAADLYALDTKTGRVKTLATVADLFGSGDENLSDAEKARRERSRTVRAVSSTSTSRRTGAPC